MALKKINFHLPLFYKKMRFIFIISFETLTWKMNKSYSLLEWVRKNRKSDLNIHRLNFSNDQRVLKPSVYH